MSRSFKKTIENFDSRFDFFLLFQALLTVAFFCQFWVDTFYRGRIVAARIGWMPSDRVMGSSLPHVGIHYFSDYSAQVIAAHLNNPWSEANTYPPFAVLIFKLFGNLPSQAGLILWLALSAVTMLVPLLLARGSGLNFSQNILLVLIICLSAPYVGTLDRGNIVFVLPILLALFYFMTTKGLLRSAGLILGTASAIKIYPLLICIYLLKHRLWSTAIWTISCFLLLESLSALAFGKFFQIASLSLHGVTSHNQLAPESQPMLFSAAGIVHNLCNAVFGQSSEISNFILRHAFILSLILLVFVVSTPNHERSIFVFLPFMYSLQLIPLQSYTYSRVWVIAAIPLLIKEPPSPLKRLWLMIIAFNLTPFSIWISNQINLFPTISFILFGFITINQHLRQYSLQSRPLNAKI
jgi:hypothetical protein